MISTARLVASSLLTITAIALLYAAAPSFVMPEREELTENEPEADRPDEAAKFRRLQLQDEHGNIPIDGFKKARQQIAVMKAARDARALAAGKPNGIKLAGIDPGGWSWLGPGNIGGRIRSIGSVQIRTPPHSRH